MTYIAKQVINITEKLPVIFMITAIIKNVRHNSRYIDGNDNDGTSRHLICGGKNIIQKQNNCRLLLVKRVVLDMHKRNQGTLREACVPPVKIQTVTF